MIFKKIITYIIFGFFIYMGLILIFQIITYLNKNGIEKELALQLKAERVSIGSILNFPLVGISLNDVEIQFGEQEKITIQDANVFYNLAILPFRGFVNSIYVITMNKVNLLGRWQNFKDHYSGKFDNGNNTALNHGINIYVNNFKTSLLYELGFHTEVDGKSLKISINREHIRIDTPFALRILINKNPVCFATDIHLRFDYDFTNSSGKGNIRFKEMNFAGISDMENGNLPFIISNGLKIDWGKSFISNYVSQINDKIVIDFEKEFDLIYSEYNELYLLDHIFSAGKYRFSLSYTNNTDGWDLHAGITSGSNVNYLYINLSGQQKEMQTKVVLNSSKYGYGNINLLLGRYTYPGGKVVLTNFTVIPGLKISGDYFLKNANSNLWINGYNTAINGGEVGNICTVLSLSSNEYVFTSPDEKFYNATLNGYLREGGFNFFVKANWVPGDVVISNAGIDLLGMGKGFYNGSARFYSGDRNALVVEADIEAVNLKKKDRRLLKTHLNYSNGILSFPLIEFPAYNLALDLNFSFTFTNFIDEIVNIYGGFYQNKQKLPIIGEVFFYNREGRINSHLLIDEAINFTSRNDGKTVDVSIDVENYDLSKFAIAGKINARFDLNYYEGLLNEIKLDTAYSYSNRNIKFIFKAKSDEDEINIKNFMLDIDSDKLIGFGKLMQSENQLSGEIRFARGGEINFSTDFDSIEGVFDIRNLFIKQFFKDNLDVFVSTRLSFKGDPLSPDIQGFLKIINSADSESFYLEIPYLSKNDGIIQLKNIVFNMDNCNARLDVSMYYNSISNYTIAGSGYLNLFNFANIDGSFNYFYQNKNPSLIYNLKNISFSGRSINNIEGGAYFQDSTYFFYNKGNSGFNGFYKLKGNDKEWNLKFMDKSIQARFEGSIYKNDILSRFYLKTPLDILSSLKIFKEIKGDLELQTSMHGRLESPQLDGSLKFYQLNLSVGNINTKIKNFTTELMVSNNRINFENYLLPTTTGKFLVNGYIDLKSLLSPDFNLLIQPYDKKPSYLSVNMYDSDLKLYGNIGIRKLNLNGKPSSLNCSGDLVLDNFAISIESFRRIELVKRSPGLIDFMNWDILIMVGNGVRFSNELLDLFLRKDDSIKLSGSVYKNSIAVKGNVGIEKGTITYFGRDFLVKEGTANFDGVQGSILPYVKIDSYYRYKDEKGENVDVFLMFEGRVDNIALKYFDSIPKKDLNELYAVLGITPANTHQSSLQNTVGSTPVGVVSAAENALIFSPLSSDLRRRLGLDIFTIRSGLIDNWSKRYILGDTNMGSIDLLEGSSLMLGKYILPNMLFQYELMLSRNPASNQEVIPLHTFGLEFDFNLFDLDWKIQPYTELGRPIKYEQKVELNINRRF